ncbi:hypothetical protein FHETE_9531 [Fusarium heterosporum]|uniref:Uncharacterized protein n=1 Tax=Fusarium heterosporum TaxID=42747 RepID=A0A8H5SYM6_FUSHE|nr:hypothetical protein FHETE_9531 [Fusarium heterosporum]
MTGLNIRNIPVKREGYSCMACFRSALGASAYILAKAKPADENLKLVKPKCCFKDAGMTRCVLCAEYGMNCALAPTMLEGDWLLLTEILEWVYGVLETHLSPAIRHALVLAAHRLCVAFDAVVMAHCKEFDLPLDPFGNWNRLLLVVVSKRNSFQPTAAIRSVTPFVGMPFDDR